MFLSKPSGNLSLLFAYNKSEISHCALFLAVNTTNDSNWLVRERSFFSCVLQQLLNNTAVGNSVKMQILSITIQFF
jgi:hypothetical protein